MYGYFAPPPPPPPNGRERRPRAQGGVLGRRTRHGEEPRGWNLRLDGAGTSIPLGLLTVSPSATVLAVEDLCWEAAVQDWKHRRPARWRFRSRKVWRAEGDQLSAKATYLRRLAGEIVRDL